MKKLIGTALVALAMAGCSNAPSAPRVATPTDTPKAIMDADLNAVWEAVPEQYKEPACAKRSDYASVIAQALAQQTGVFMDEAQKAADQLVKDRCPAPPLPTPTPTPEPVFQPDEDAFAAVWLKTNGWKDLPKSHEFAIDFGWNICLLLKQDYMTTKEVQDLAHPNPRKGKAIVAAAKKYLCPDVT